MNFTIIGCYIVVLQLMLTNCSADRRQDEGGESAVEGKSVFIINIHIENELKTVHRPVARVYRRGVQGIFFLSGASKLSSYFSVDL